MRRGNGGEAGEGDGDGRNDARLPRVEWDLCVFAHGPPCKPTSINIVKSGSADVAA